MRIVLSEEDLYLSIKAVDLFLNEANIEELYPFAVKLKDEMLMRASTGGYVNVQSASVEGEVLASSIEDYLELEGPNLSEKDNERLELILDKF